MTDYDRMTQAAEWKEVLQQAKKDGTFKPEKGTRTRDYIAQILGVAPATIGDLERINNNATDAVKEQLKEGNMKLTTAAETSRLPEEDQNNIAEAVAAGEDVKAKKSSSWRKKRKKKSIVKQQWIKCKKLCQIPTQQKKRRKTQDDFTF